MKHEMTEKDFKHAALALIDWIESQEIAQHNAVRVLTTTVIAIIKEIAVSQGLEARDGGKIIAEIIVESLR